MKPIEEMTELELREAVAVEVMGLAVGRVEYAPELGEDSDYVPYRNTVTGQELRGLMYSPGMLVVGNGAVPAYESSIEAAFEVVEKTRDIQNRWGGANRVLLEQKPDGTFKAAFYGATTNWEAWAWCDATTAARAICIAALKAVRAK